MSSVSELQNWSKAVRGHATDGAAEGMGALSGWFQQCLPWYLCLCSLYSLRTLVIRRKGRDKR